MVDEYNSHVERANVYKDVLMPSMVKDSLPALSIARLRPTKNTLMNLEDRMALPLGDTWMRDVKSILIKDMEEKEAQDG